MAKPTKSPGLPDWRQMPANGDPAIQARGFDAWATMLAELPEEGRAAAKLAQQLAAESAKPGATLLLASLFGHSPYLTSLALAEPQAMLTLLRQGPEVLLDQTLADLRKIAGKAAADELMQPLRQAKRRVALAVAVADIAEIWPLERVTGALSDFAALVIDTAMAATLRDAAARGDIDLPHPEQPCLGSGFVALGMGKLGARELNYSSDIDLIMLFDQEVVRYRGRKSALECYVRLTQQMVRLLHEHNADGYVFRTDLRLRPDPGSTPVALSMAAAETYYESFGQNWERAAMIKARPVGGDIVAGKAFLARLTPYVWRKNLDFAAIEDIHSIKRQIHAHKGHGEIAVEGHNLKLGRGGIREIEFFAQTQQLIAGGRDSRLRAIGTVEALNALVATERLDPATARELTADYGYLRKVEHRLQMANDEQTHSLPGDAAGIARIAAFLGEPDAASFRAKLLALLHRVKTHYDALFAEAPNLGSDQGSLVFTGTDDDPETLATLQRLGFAQPADIAAMVRGWHFGRYRAMRSERAREKLTAIMPSLLEAFSGTGSPDEAIRRFDLFLSLLPAGVQLFSLLQSNPAVLTVLAELLAAAPHLADSLAQNPALFDSLLEYAETPPDFAPERLAASLARQLGSARDFQDVLDWTRRWTGELRLQVGIGLLRGRLDGAAAGRALSSVADAVLAELLHHVQAEFAQAHGAIPGAKLALIGLGRLGSRELTLESDLDLLLLYEHSAKAQQSDGKRPLTPGLYFARLCPRFINAITAMTGEGRLFEVDMRLRPSGNAGPIASDLQGFGDYQRKEAWTWEHMALTRARVVTAAPALAKKFNALRLAVLGSKRDPRKLLANVADMRRRLAQAKPGKSIWSLKHHRGGLVDIEFITQYLQLRDGHAKPAILDPNPLLALQAIRDAGCLPGPDADMLLDAARLQGDLLALTRLAGADAGKPTQWPPALAKRLPALLGEPDLERLTLRLEAAQAAVYQLYDSLVEQPAAPYLSLADMIGGSHNSGDQA
ncbi:bifunctional [glutamine synthetase] adenylyltransferase/[glutamine synthetase]-adenylyl-L-tyrosine phosphorylase [Ferrovibrio sp.]|uniref:bifunctional [glutamine synthetase] adenylyltransferase/[glutamine synthetase]-adenylyl-L-tyrosine phosphorylase n=1 Tax=Ferrovibrio sp. TaxID=1917215 RepID=UPI0025B979F7|nr:bifunctional [glutamine synthetase] adenylyltransferase/[glutamine synthetase]-adenylyl-L-tyrosine phosphorylase [Ferrovibrio sp.]